MSVKSLFLESVAGIAGDMFSASFVDAGLIDIEELQVLPKILGLEGVRVEVSNPIKATMKTTHLNVTWTSEMWKQALGGEHSHGGKGHSVHHSHANVLAPQAGKSHWHTHYMDLDRFLERSKLEDPVKAFARKVFRCLAEAEADAHGMKVEDVAFHEVGAVDSILDVVMAATCVYKVAPSHVYASPVKLGRGLIQIEHGSHPVPPPAAARLVIGFQVAAVPAAIVRENVELSTPTGLAILKALNPTFVDSLPAGIVRAQGMGSGTMDLGVYPNVFRVTCFEESASRGMGNAKLPYERDQVVEITCNLDDETAERSAWVAERLLKQGALDVWMTPVIGKKGRPALEISLLAEHGEWEKLADWLLRNSSTFGLRHRSWDRLKLARHFETRQTEKGPVRFKIGQTTTGEVLKEKAEYEDLRRVWELG